MNELASVYYEALSGLQNKYLVERRDGKPLKGGGCIVLEFGDPNSREALLGWVQTQTKLGNYALANEVRQIAESQECAHCHTLIPPSWVRGFDPDEKVPVHARCWNDWMNRER